MTTTSSAADRSTYSSLTGGTSNTVGQGFSPTGYTDASITTFTNTIAVTLPTVQRVDYPTGTSLPHPHTTIATTAPNNVIDGYYGDYYYSNYNTPMTKYRSMQKMGYTGRGN